MDLSVCPVTLPFLGESLWRISGARCIRRLSRMVELSRLPYQETRPAVAALVDDFEGRWKGNEMMSVFLVRFSAGVLDAQVGSQAALAVHRAGLEWEIARVRDGRYPVAAESIDPFSGRALIQDAARGTLSSVGPPGGSKLPEDAPDLTWKLRAQEEK